MRKTAKQVLAEVADRHGLTIADLIGPSRKRKYVLPRFEAVFEIYIQCPHLSYTGIGRTMGGRDHTTIIHAVKRHCEITGKAYESVRRETAYYTRVMPFKRSVHTPATLAHYREVQRYAV